MSDLFTQKPSVVGLEGAASQLPQQEVIPSTPPAAMEFSQLDTFNPAEFMHTDETAAPTPDRMMNTMQNLTLGGGSIIAGMVDTLGTSLRILNDDAVDNYLKGSTLGDFYTRNKDWARTIADLGTFMIPGMLGAKAMEGAGFVARTAKTAGMSDQWLSRIFTSTSDTGTLLKGLEARALTTAGRTGQIDWSLATGPDWWRANAKSFITGSVVDSVKRNIGFEIGTYAFMNKSDTLYPDDFSAWDYAVYNAALPLAATGVELAYTRKLLAGVAERAGAVGRKTVLGETDNLVGVSRPGNRDIALTQSSHLLAKLDEAEKNIGSVLTDKGDLSKLQSNIQAQRGPLLSEQKGDINALSTDKPFKEGVTTSWSMDPRQTNVVRDALDDNAYKLLGLTSLEPIASEGKAADIFLSAKRGRLSSLTRQIKETRTAMETAAQAGDNDIAFGHAEELTKLRDEKTAVNALHPVVIDAGGQIMSARERPVIAQDIITSGDIHIVPGLSATDEKRITFPRDKAQFRGMEIGWNDLMPKLPESEMTKAADSGTAFLGGQDVTAYAKRYPIPTASEVKPEDFVIRPDLLNLKDINIKPEDFSRTIGTQTVEQRTALYAGYEKYVDSFVKAVQAGTNEAPIYIDPLRHYIFADVADELYKRLGDADFYKHVALPSNLKIEDVRFAGLQGKYRDYMIWQDQWAKAAGDMKAKNQLMTPTAFNYYANLPHPEPGSTTKLGELFKSLRMQGELDFKTGLGKMDAVDKAANSATVAPEFPGIQTLLSATPQAGKMLNYGLKDNKAVVAVYRDVPPVSPTYKSLINSAMQQRQTQLTLMSNAAKRYGDIIGQSVFEKLSSSAIVNAAADVNSLGNGSQRGKGVITTFKTGAGDATAIQGADAINSEVSKLMEHMIPRLLSDAGFTEASSALLSDKNALQNAADYFASMRSGWDVKVDLHEVGTDGFHRVLNPESKRNQRLWQSRFGEAMPSDEKVFMPAPTITSAESPNYIPLLIKPEMLPMLQAADKLGGLIEGGTNHLFAQAGRGPVNHREGWIPAVNLANEHVNFIRNPDTDEILYVATGKSIGEMRSLTEQALTAFQKEGIPVIEEAPRTTGSMHQAYDQAFDRLINMSDPIAQTGGTSGKLGGPVVPSGEKAIADLQEAYQAIFRSQFRRNTVIFMEPYVKQVRAMDEAVEATARSAEGNTTPTKKWLSLIYGNTGLDRTQDIGGGYAKVESFIDKKLEALQNLMRPGSVAVSAKTEKQYKDYSEYMGEYNPFSTAVDFAERTVPQAMPLTMKRITTEINHLTTVATLRLFELGQPLLNYTSLAATMPAVIKALQPMRNEDRATWLKRIGPFGSAITVDGSDAVFNAPRLLATGVHNYWNKMETIDGKLVKLTDWAAQQGYFSQQVSDMAAGLAKPGQTDLRRRVEGTIDWLSKPADSSEVLSRAFSWHSGYEIAESLGIKYPKDKASFAHKFANDVVGDYRPGNRPQIFQGAVGMPLGLFTTFMWNYNERLFKYIENKNTRAFYTQMATQASLFGAQSVPGYSQFVNVFASNYDGSTNPSVGLEQRFGTPVADWWNFGLLSNLPKMFGADDGIAMYQRGDAGLKMIPTLYNPTQAAPVQAITKMYQALSGVISNVRNNGVRPNEIADILAQYSLSRPFKNAIQLYHGYSTDNLGRVINEDTNTFMGTISRLVGMKELQEAKSTQAWANVAAGRTARADKLDELRDNITNGFRDNLFSGPEAGNRLMDKFRDYYDNGGTADGFSEFVRNAAVRATVNRNDAEMMKLLKGQVSTKEQSDAKRLFWAHAPTHDLDFMGNN